MSVISIGGGPHPQARIVQVDELYDNGDGSGVWASAGKRYEIRDANNILASCEKFSHAKALLPLIQSGE